MEKFLYIEKKTQCNANSLIIFFHSLFFLLSFKSKARYRNGLNYSSFIS